MKYTKTLSTLRFRRIGAALVVAAVAVLLATVGANTFGSARAKAARQKSSDSSLTKLGALSARKSSAAQPARRRNGSPSSKATSKLTGGQRAALAACNDGAPNPISIPQTVNGALTAAPLEERDCQLDDGTFYDIYTFEGTAGQQVSILLTSNDFNAYLFLVDFDGVNITTLGQNNSGGGGTNARIPSGTGFATLPYTGTYFILANAFDPSDSTGNYTLTLAGGSGQCPATPGTINIGQTPGTLNTGDCRFVNDTFFDAYVFNGTARQQISIAMTAGFDTFLFLLDANKNIIGSNDDQSTGVFNSRLPPTTSPNGFITLPYTGTYYVIANAFPSNPDVAPPTGGYTLTLTSGGTCASTAINFGQQLNGTLNASASECLLPDETLIDLYSFDGMAGQQVSIEMMAAILPEPMEPPSGPGLDTFLLLNGPSDQTIAVDDDGGNPPPNSRIPAGSGFFTLPATGTYYIFANTFAFGDGGNYTLSLAVAPPAATTLQFSNTSFASAEGLHSVTINVTRTGPTTAESSVDYATTDGTATERKDYTTAVGRLRFAVGETSKSFDILVTDDRFADSGEGFNVTLSNPVGATLGSQITSTVPIADNDAANGPSPVKDASIEPPFFVRQHYADFLNRVPDQAGLDFWIGRATGCGQSDLLVCRINVSAAFFLSIENQETGYLTHRAYKVAYGNLTGKPVPLTYREYIAGGRQIGEGVIVGMTGWEAVLEANKVAFFNEFVMTSRFTALYNGLNNDQYVDALNANAGGALSQAERDALVADLNTTAKTRAQVLRAVAEDVDFAGDGRPEKNRAFVLAQYFGYLRRNPDDTDFRGVPDPNFEGYNFWLGKLNEFNGNFVRAEMVRAFIQSIEYGERFGQ